jgi:hypothetical protein
MKQFMIGASLMIAVLCSSASAGDFRVTLEDYGTIEVEYTGEVYDSDVSRWDRIVEIADGRTIILTINSGGGSAYGGLDLYWALEAYENLVTIAGADYGAWSAAAIMWTAGDYRMVEAGGAVWFHSAYCNWDPDPQPNIGCDTRHFQDELIKALDDAGFDGEIFNYLLNMRQLESGTDGWIGKSNKGWFERDTTDWTIWPFDLKRILP